jgi:hypothetical protein
MTTAAIRQKLSTYIQIADDKKLKAVYTLLEDDMQDGERISISQYNKEIDTSMEEVKRGEVYRHDEVVEMSKKW